MKTRLEHTLDDIRASTAVKDNNAREQCMGHDDAKKLILRLAAEVEDWKDATGLERGGDPDGVRPDHLRRFIAELEDGYTTEMAANASACVERDTALSRISDLEAARTRLMGRIDELASDIQVHMRDAKQWRGRCADLEVALRKIDEIRKEFDESGFVMARGLALRIKAPCEAVKP